MSEFILEVKERQVDKQSQLTEIRQGDRVPGVIYGFKQKPVTIDMEYNVLLKVLKEAGSSNIITLKIGDKNIKTIVREYQQNPVTDKLTHVDFMATVDNRLLNTEVPLEFVGTSKAVREQGGKLNIKNDKVKVKCLPADLPAKIEVDVSVFKEMGQKLVISDLQVDDKVTILNNPNDPVVDVTIPKKIEIQEVTPAEGEVPAEGEEGLAEGEVPAEGEAPAEGGEAKPAEGGEAKPAADKKE